MGTGASVVHKKLEAEQRRQDETTKRAEELVSSSEERHEAVTSRLKAENASLRDHVQDLDWALQQQTELWRQEKAKNVSLTFSRLPLPMLEMATGLSVMQPDVHTSQLLSSATSLNRTYPMATVAYCDVVGFSRLTTNLSAVDALSFVDKLHIMVDEAFSRDGLYIVDQSADRSQIVTGLTDPNQASNASNAKSITKGGKPGSRVKSVVKDDPGYETKESEDELVGVEDEMEEGGGNQRHTYHLATDKLFAPVLSKSQTSTSGAAANQTKSKVAGPVTDAPRRGPSSPAACALEMAKASLDLMSSSIDFHIPSRPSSEQIQLRLALHSGPCIVGVTGLRQLSSGMDPGALGYTVPAARMATLGNTPREAEQLCCTSLALQIRVSQSCRELLLRSGTACHLERCPDIPSQRTSNPDLLNTYWLVGMDLFKRSLPPLEKAVSLSEYNSL